MRPANVPSPRDFRNNRSFLKRQENTDMKSKLRERIGKRRQIGLSNNAGHVRGGHSFH